MTDAPDFDRKMLLVATQLAHEHQMKYLLLNILEAMAGSLSSAAGTSSTVEGLTLVRYYPISYCALSYRR